MVLIQCPSCKHVQSVPPSASGEDVLCKDCQRVLVVPGSSPGATTAKVCGMAIAGFVLTFLCAPLGVIFSIVGLIKTAGGRSRGRALAIAGLAVSMLVLLIVRTQVYYGWKTRHELRHRLTWIEMRIMDLGDGAFAYARDNDGLFPGQFNCDLLGSGDGKITGSEMLARSMFGSADPNVAKGLYASFTNSDIIHVGGRPAVSDRGRASIRAAMPICYYPARPGNGFNLIDRFREEDNAAITNARRGGSLRKFVESRLGKDGIPRVSFILIAPGPSGLYFTEDNITNF